MTNGEAVLVDDLRRCLQRQFESAWSLLTLHLSDLDEREVLWRPARVGLHVHEAENGLWRADWPESEDYSAGPPSLAWLTWHIGFWWTMCLDHTFSGEAGTRESIHWPGSVESTRMWLGGLRRRWVEQVAALEDGQMASTTLAVWPFRERPFVDVVAWVNSELMKNAAEIGVIRFLYAVQP